MSETVPIKEHPPYSHMTAEIYDLLYANKNYAAEAAKITKIIEDHCESGGNEILEVACGTGTYLGYLEDEFTVEGFDLSPEQVAAAKQRLPEINIFQADMLNFNTGKQYDTVLCLFSSIGYLKSKENLDIALAKMANHTKPGGLVLIEPWLRVEDLIPGYISLESGSGDGIWVSRMGTHTNDGKISTLNMHHMVGRNDTVDHFVEVHELALYTDEEITDAFVKAGLEVYIDPEGLNRRLFIGKKPTT